jgi:nucleoid-associated protein YgaU
MRLTIWLNLLAMIWVGALPGEAQNSIPGTIQDPEAERRELLKAVDQIEILMQRTEKLQEELSKAQEQIAELEKANRDVKLEMEAAQAAHRKERDALLDEVSKLLAETQSASPDSSGVAASSDEGYEHVVKRGQSLWAIAKAFQDQGVAVTVDDIRKANRLGQNDLLQVGQKLFIPKPN